MFSIVDLVIILSVIAIMFSYILVTVYFFRIVNEVEEEMDKKVPNNKKLLNKLEERLNGKN